MKIFYRNFRRFGDNEYHEVSAEEMNRYNEVDFDTDYEGGMSEGVALEKIENGNVYFEYVVYC